MKLASYIADGKECLRRRRRRRRHHHERPLRRPLPRRCAKRSPAALLPRDQGSCVARRRPDHKLSRHQVPAGHPEPGKDPLRRHQLQVPCRRARHRGAEAAEHLHQIRQHARRARRRDAAAEGVDQLRLRGRARAGDRQGRPPHQGRRRAQARRRLHLLLRRLGARLHQVLAGRQQELPAHRARSAPGW